MRTTRGVTLLELLVALTMVGVLAGVVELALQPKPVRAAGLGTLIDSLRERALRSGRAQAAVLRDSTKSGRVLVLPTGRVISDSSLDLDPLTGVERR